MKRVMATALMGAAIAIAASAPMAFADTQSPAPTPTTTTQAPATAKPAAAPTAGHFCKKSLQGKSAKASDGTVLVCAAGSDGKDRWTKK